MVDYGAGPAITENFDFDIDRTGDIRTISGQPELEKDLALKVAEVLDSDGIGGRLTGEEREQLRVRVGQAIKSDERITELRRLTINLDPDNRNRIVVVANTTAGNGPFEGVIPV